MAEDISLEDVDAFLDLFEEEVVKELARDTLQFAATRIGATAATRYMQRAGRDPGRRSPQNTGPLRIVQGRLIRGLLGSRTQTVPSWGDLIKGTEVIAALEIRKAQAQLTYGTRVPYAVAHETGMTIVVPTTSKMVDFFWAKYYEQTRSSRDPSGTRPFQSSIKVGGDLQARTVTTIQESPTAQRWKAMALAAREQSQFKIQMPQRAFLGPAFNDSIDDIQDFLARGIAEAWNEVM